MLDRITFVVCHPEYYLRGSAGRREAIDLMHQLRETGMGIAFPGQLLRPVYCMAKAADKTFEQSVARLGTTRLLPASPSATPISKLLRFCILVEAELGLQL